MKITNRKAYYDYEIGEKVEAGIKLTGAEVKSVRLGHVSLIDSFVKIIGSDAMLINCHINPYQFADNTDYDPKRSRKLLLHKKEMLALQSKTQQSNLTIIPVSLYTTRNLIKVELALARGKKKWDKRKALKEKSLKREEEEETRVKR
ncbi:SsrA-binding protein SmpB [Candidatus Gottesmanbacteria bacterium]|nr:SsrA-binding protein SmpB [Candidatus Gottesmanbacteria bacterium]